MVLHPHFKLKEINFFIKKTDGIKFSTANIFFVSWLRVKNTAYGLFLFFFKKNRNDIMLTKKLKQQLYFLNVFLSFEQPFNKKKKKKKVET